MLVIHLIERIIGSVEDEFKREPPVFLADSLSPGRIVFDVSAPCITDAIPQILSRTDSAELVLFREKIARAVLEREAVLSTYLGQRPGHPACAFRGHRTPATHEG